MIPITSKELERKADRYALDRLRTGATTWLGRKAHDYDNYDIAEAYADGYRDALYEIERQQKKQTELCQKRKEW